MTAKFWIGGSGNFSDATHWSTSSGGANNTTKPTSADNFTVDGHASGLNGGTLTIDEDIACQSMAWGAAVGTIDNSANHNVTLTGVSSAWMSNSGTGARTFTGGSGTYTVSGNFAATSGWSMGTLTNFTNPTTAFSSATIVMVGTGTLGGTFAGGAMTYGTVTFTGHASIGGYTISGANIIGTLNITAPNVVLFPAGATNTITNAFAWTGTSADRIQFGTTSNLAVATITTGSATTNTAAWATIRGITFTPVGGSTLTASSSLNMGENSGTGFTITPPATGGGGVIGS